MVSICSIFFIVFAFFSGRVQCAQWSSTSLPDRQMLYACVGDNVTLIWQYVLTSMEVHGDVQWLYDGLNWELVAVSLRGNFFPTPTFSQRVVWVDNAGLSLSRVLVPDSGNYSVVVNVYNQAGVILTVLHRSVVLHVSDRLMTSDGVLHVTQLRDPVYDSVSSQWVIQLQCVNFIFKDNPPYQLEWTTPSGDVHNSTSFSNGNFYLSVPMPIESGSYTCRIPPHLSARACLRGNGTSEGQASVTVESVTARLLLLEKENWDLKHKPAHVNNELPASRLTSQNQTVADLASRLTSQSQLIADLASRLTLQNQTVADLISRVTSQNQEVQQLNFQLRQTQGQLSTTATELQTRLAKVEDINRNQVAFHATGLSTPSVSVGFNSLLEFPDVFYNQGNAFNSSTGIFTAPYSGLYFFIAKTSPARGGVSEAHSLMVESLSIDTATTYNAAGSTYSTQSPVRGVVHLTQGQRVYVVRPFPLTEYKLLYSAFTGFLLSRDP